MDRILAKGAPGSYSTRDKCLSMANRNLQHQTITDIWEQHQLA